MWDVPLGARRRALSASPSLSRAFGVDPLLASPYRCGVHYDGYSIGGLMTTGELEACARWPLWEARAAEARSAELAARSADLWRREELAASAADLRALALEGDAIRSSSELGATMEMMERATGDFSVAHSRARDAEATLHNTRVLLADRKAAFACAVRNANFAAAEAADLDFRADLAKRDARLLGVPPVSRRWWA